MKSIRRSLLGWLLLGIALTALIEDVSTYIQARRALDRVFDARLQVIALSIADQNEGTNPRSTIGQKDGPTLPLIQIWNQSGVLSFTSNSNIDIPETTGSGLTTVAWKGRRWRFFVLRSSGKTIRVGETLETRRGKVALIARQINTPLAVTFVPALALLIWAVVGRQLRPLTDLAKSLGRRAPDALEPLTEEPKISELHPMVVAVNDLLARVQRTLATERRFIADATHEMQTPLTAIRLQLQGLVRAATGEARNEALARLEQGIERTTRLVSQMLTLARVDRGVDEAPARALSLGEVVVESIAEFTVVAQMRGVDLGTHGIEAAQVHGDPAALAVLVDNLIENAVRYSPPGGSVDVNLRRGTAGPILEVIDSGPGIPIPERERVLDRFYRGSTIGIPGSGLGLSIVKRIADQHHAELVLGEGPNGAGLRVEVRFRDDASSIDHTGITR